jgi:hypothetical protein
MNFASKFEREEKERSEKVKRKTREGCSKSLFSQQNPKETQELNINHQASHIQ